MKRAPLEKYRRALDEAVSLAQGDLKRAFDVLLGSGIPMQQVRDGLIEATFDIASTYGDITATASAEWYEQLRPTRLGEYQAVLAETVSYGEVEGSVRYAAGHLFSDDPQQTLRVLNGSLQRMVEGPARDTIHQNALRDPSKPRWARVPSGGKTCAWCFMLCSRGFVYKTETTAGGEGNRFHDDDRCMIVPGWGTNPTIEGYDPESMYDLYQKAWSPGATDKDVARLMRRANPQLFTDGVWKRRTAPSGLMEWELSELPKPLQGQIRNPHRVIMESHEIATYNRLARAGFDVDIRAVSYDGGKNPDIEIAGVVWEAKSPKGSGKHTISNQMRRAKKQSERVVIDMARTTLAEDEVLDELRRRLKDSKLQEIMFVRRDETIVRLTKP